MTTLSLPRKGNRRGFSMPEMLVTLVMIAVLVAVAAPKVSGMFTRDQVKRSIDRLSSDMNLARMRAIRSGRSVRVVSNGSTGWYVIASKASGADTLRRVNLTNDAKGVTLSTFDLTFTGRGVLSGNGTTITATRNSRSEDVIITTVGRIYRDY